MSWFFDAAPYILAAATIVLGAFEILKDWKDYEKKWLQISVAIVFIVAAVVSILSLHHDTVEKEKAAKNADAQMKALQGKVDAAKDALEGNTKLFLGSMQKTQDEISDLKTQVRTEDLQKRLASVQSELQNTQKALAPGPKAELTFTFVPWTNPAMGEPIHPATETLLPAEPNGSVHVEFTVLNITPVEAENVSLNVQICDQCTYASEPEGMNKIPGMSDTLRELTLSRLPAMGAFKTISLDIMVPPGIRKFMVGFTYRCTTCVLPRAASQGVVNILRLRAATPK